MRSFRSPSILAGIAGVVSTKRPRSRARYLTDWVFRLTSAVVGASGQRPPKPNLLPNSAAGTCATLSRSKRRSNTGMSPFSMTSSPPARPWANSRKSYTGRASSESTCGHAHELEPQKNPFIRPEGKTRLHKFIIGSGCWKRPIASGHIARTSGLCQLFETHVRTCGLSRTASMRTIRAFNPLCRQPIRHFSILK